MNYPVWDSQFPGTEIGKGKCANAEPSFLWLRFLLYTTCISGILDLSIMLNFWIFKYSFFMALS